MITAGKYSVWFKTPIGEGAGIINFYTDGSLDGGDSTFAYSGGWKVEKGRFRADLVAKREHPGPPGVFALDVVDLIVRSEANDDERFSGFARQAPALKLEVTLTEIR